MTQTESDQLKTDALRAAIEKLDAELRAMPQARRNDALARVVMACRGQARMERHRREHGL